MPFWADLQYNRKGWAPFVKIGLALWSVSTLGPSPACLTKPALVMSSSTHAWEVRKCLLKLAFPAKFLPWSHDQLAVWHLRASQSVNALPGPHFWLTFYCCSVSIKFLLQSKWKFEWVLQLPVSARAQCVPELKYTLYFYNQTSSRLFLTISGW